MTDAIDELSQVLSDPAEVLSDPAALLFGLEAEFAVVSVVRTGPAAVKVIIEQAAREGPCPSCGVLSAAVKERPLVRVKDLPACGQQVELWWRKRRLWCRESLCPRRSFTQACEAVKPRARITERLRDKLASAIAGSNRPVSDVAAEYGVSWPTAHKALVVAAARWLPTPEPTRRLGIDETRFALGPLDLGRHHLEAVESVADQLRRLLPRRAGIPAGVGSWPVRRLRA